MDFSSYIIKETDICKILQSIVDFRRTEEDLDHCTLVLMWPGPFGNWIYFPLFLCRCSSVKIFQEIRIVDGPRNGGLFGGLSECEEGRQAEKGFLGLPSSSRRNSGEVTLRKLPGHNANALTPLSLVGHWLEDWKELKKTGHNVHHPLSATLPFPH